MTKSCTICFCQFEKQEKKYSCVEKECDNKICEECISTLIEFSEKSNIIPKCPSQKCNGIFTLSDIKGLHKDYINLYNSACFKYMMTDKGDSVKKRIQEAKILSDIRSERIKYLEKEYPKAISLVAQIAFNDRVKALDKQKGKLVNAQINTVNRTCMNLTCNGFLDPNFVCMTCGTEFCKSCEKKLVNSPNHICAQEDLDSVNIVNSMVKCPGCKLPVFKNEGCDSITCSNCGINFAYTTGKIGGHGSHNVKLQKTISIKKKEKLSNILEKEITNECLGLLLEFEALEPHVKRKETILNPLRDYLKDGNKEIAGKRIALNIDKYYNYIVKNKQFHKILTIIEEKVRQKEDIEKLKEYLEDSIKKFQ